MAWLLNAFDSGDFGGIYIEFAPQLNIAALVIFCVFLCFFVRQERVREGIDGFICRIVGNGLSSTYVALVTLVFGALFSVYSSELKSEMQNGIGVTVSLSLFGLVCLFFILKKNDEVIQSDLKNKEARLDNQINNLKAHLSNMPPKSVLSNISQHVIMLNELVLNNSVDNELKIKAILRSIVTLAKMWDGHGDNDDVDYNINLMLLLDCSAVKREILQGGDEYKKAIEASPFFLFSDNVDSCLDNCNAILYTKREYSISTNQERSISECDTPCMCLPVSFNLDSNRQPNIFGAAASVESKKAIYIPDTAEALRKFILDAQSSHPRFSGKFKASLEEYYRERRASIYSIPLLEQNGNVLSIVNIYQNNSISSNNKMILRSEEHAGSFYYLMAPICNMLVQVLQELESDVELEPEQSDKVQPVELKSAMGG